MINNLNELDRELSILKIHNSTHKSFLKQANSLRLDWGFSADEKISEDYSSGMTKSILITELRREDNPYYKHRDKFLNSELSLFLVESFISKNKLDLDTIFKIHSRIIINGGKLRTSEVYVDTKGASKKYFVKAAETKDELDKLIQWYNDEILKNKTHKVLIAALFHYRFVHIHPFIDGNGTVARIMTSLILLKFGYPPPIFDLSKRDQYLESLDRVDSDNEFTLLDFIIDGILNSTNLISKSF